VNVATACFIARGDCDAAQLDAATLDGCRAGNAAALRAFVTRYEHTVFAFLSRALGPGPHVEDLAQEVFIRACRALPGFDAAGTARLSTWLLTIASRVAIDARRKRRGPTMHLDFEVASTPGTPETERRRSEIGRALQQAAQALSDDHRDVFILAEFHDLEMKEIAAVLGVPENTVKTRLFRARERLRLLLRGVWEESK
jgi:RNA polymerase sigma-70 factor (ECF subfamily)